MQDGLMRPREALMHSFLRRLSLSPYRSGLILRGSMLTRQWCPERSADDLDFVDQTNLPLSAQAQAIADIAALPDPTHETTLDVHNTLQEVIWANSPWPGTRVLLQGKIQDHTEVFQVDLGSGDPLSEGHWLLPWPGTPLPLLITPPQTLFAWKTHGLFEFGRGKWRAKDAYDLLLLHRHFHFSTEELIRPLKVAFESRLTPFSLAQPFLEDPLWGFSRSSQRKWRTFQRRSQMSLPELPDVINPLKELLSPLLHRLTDTHAPPSTGLPPG